jgi:hypothetical protein
MGILCAWVLSTVLPGVLLLGRHPEKLRLARWRDMRTGISGDGPRDRADLVVDATGSPGGCRGHGGAGEGNDVRDHIASKRPSTCSSSSTRSPSSVRDAAPSGRGSPS